jgi:hypothetical protein
MGQQKQVFLELEVKSTHPNIPTPTLLTEMEAALPKFRADLSKGRTVERPTLQREGTFPVDAHTATVALGAFVGTVTGVIGKEFVKKFADDAYDWIKQKWPSGSFSLTSVSEKGTTKRAKAAANKKTRKARKP